MKRLLDALLVFAALSAVLSIGYTTVAQTVANRIKAKGALAEVELGTDLYINPQPVTIDGYDASAMEPFIAPDGRSLFFNNINDPGVDTNLHVATRIGARAFRYVGEVAGVNSPVLDAVASMDVGHHFYFTSVRQ